MGPTAACQRGAGWSATSLVSMQSIGAYDAKTHLASLLDEVERGSTITITRHGRPVARLVPASGRGASTSEVIEQLRGARIGVTLGPDTIRDLVDVGRR